MTKIGNVLFELLRAGLWGRSPETGLLPLNEAEWGQIYDMAADHTVVGLVFQGICMLPDELMPPQEQLDLWVVHVDKIERSNREMNKAQASLLSFFHEKGLRPVVLKGQGVAAMYDNPLQRACGDIDLFFYDNEYDEALKVLRDVGISPKLMADGAYLYQWQHVEVEIHSRFLDIHNPFLQKDVSKLVAEERTEGDCPSPLMTMLLLNAHILKHMIGPGIGLRQIADMARACYALDGKYDKNRYDEYCRRWHIEGWTMQLNALLHDYLGVSGEFLHGNIRKMRVNQHILEKIIKGGNFGKHHGGKHEAEGFTKKLYTLKHVVSGWTSLFRLAPFETMCFTWHLVVRQGKG